MRFRTVLVAAALLGSVATQAAPPPANDYVTRRAAWSMQPVGPLPATPPKAVKTWKPVFAQQIAPVEVATVTASSTLIANGMPLAKGPTPVTIVAGSQYFRVATTDPAMRIYCGPGVGYTASATMVKVSSRICLGDLDGNARFDNFMIANVVPTAPVNSLLLALLRIDTAGITPMFVGSLPENQIDIPFATARGTEIIAAGPVIVRSGKSYGIALGIGSGESMRLLRGFDLASEAPPTRQSAYPFKSEKSFGFKDARPIDLSQLPAEVEFYGARLRIVSAKGDQLQVEVLQGMPADRSILIGYSGLLAVQAAP